MGAQVPPIPQGTPHHTPHHSPRVPPIPPPRGYRTPNVPPVFAKVAPRVAAHGGAFCPTAEFVPKFRPKKVSHLCPDWESY